MSSANSVAPLSRARDPGFVRLRGGKPTELKKKAEAQLWHFIARARERFGIKLTVARYHRLIRQVEDSAPGTVFVRHQPPERTIWIIRAAGHDMRVVYDHTTARLVTCLPVFRDSENSGQIPGCQRAATGQRARDRLNKRRRLLRAGLKVWK